MSEYITINIPVDALPAIVVVGLMIIVPLFYRLRDSMQANRKRYREYQKSLLDRDATT